MRPLNEAENFQNGYADRKKQEEDNAATIEGWIDKAKTSKDGIYRPNEEADKDEDSDDQNQTQENLKPKYSYEEYIKYWESTHSTPMTEDQKENLKAGCVGVVAVELENNRRSDGMPPMDRTYSSFELAQKKAKELEKTSNQRVIIYSIRFWSFDPNMFKPDKNGVVKMNNDWHYKAKGVGYYNFDFGLYDQKNNTWWDANNGVVPGLPPMEIKHNTLSHFSRRLLSYNRRVFCIATTTMKLK